LALALALATVGSALGADVDLSGVADDSVAALFAESNSRFVVSVKPEDVAAFEALFADVPVQSIGVVSESDSLTIEGLATLDRDTMRTQFKATLQGV
jgi:phosphoribosylformylglycinamidine synthase